MQAGQPGIEKRYIDYVMRLKEYLRDNNLKKLESTSSMVYESIADSLRKKLEMLNVEALDHLLWKLPLDQHDESLFYVDLLIFIAHSEDIIRMVATAALKRKSKGIPALEEQDTQEQLQHCMDHLKNWINGDCGDESTVVDQAKHTVCRALLAYFTMQQEEKYGLLETYEP